MILKAIKNRSEKFEFHNGNKMEAKILWYPRLLHILTSVWVLLTTIAGWNLLFQWNVTPLIRQGSNFFSLHHMAPLLNLMFLFFIACLPSRRRREAMRAITIFWPLFGVPSTLTLVEIYNTGPHCILVINSNSSIKLPCTVWETNLNLSCFIPLRAKPVGEFIEIRHKKISPTSILSTLGCL